MNAGKVVGQIDRKIKKWMAEWVSSKTSRELFLGEPTDGLKDYINGLESSDALGGTRSTWLLGI